MSALPREPAREVPKRPSPTFDDVATRVREDLYGPISGERRKLAVALILAALIGGAHLARVGTAGARIAAAIIVVLAIVLPAVLEIVARRRARDARAVVASAGFALGRFETHRALEHVSLAERIVKSPDHEGVSPSLARLHASRALGKLDLERLRPVGERFGALGRTAALVLIVLTLVVLAIAPARFVEGVDVALARRGVAPIPLPWLDDVVLTVHPPMYVHKNNARYHGYGGLVAERGSELLVRGMPKRGGRTLLLADDHHEVPFIDDGTGGVVARWSVTVSGQLRVRARFGDVAIDEPHGWELVAIQDETPTVVLEGAPGSIEIAKSEGTIPLRYDASDDHGLREVHLVIRIGAREDRRVLAKLDGEPKHDRGGYVLRTTDPLIAKARTPVRVRIEARDNDPITGPKWGRSADLTLIPPVLGAAEAKRYEDAVATRDELVDLLAKAIAVEGKADAAAAGELSKAFDTTAESLEAFLSSSHDGLRVPSRVAMFVRGRLRKVREAIGAETKAPSNATHAATVAAVERVVLAFDGAVHSLGARDTRTVAKLLSEVANDAAESLRELGNRQGDVELTSRVDVDVKALDGGGASLRRLGELGRDLGEIVENDLRRVARARDGKDLPHAELAMRDLAMRLHLPVASFGGGSNPSAPGEPTDDDGGESGEESEGEESAAKQQQQLEDLTKEHGDAVGSVEDLLREAEDPKQLEGLEEEAKRRAKRLRDSVGALPKNGGLKKTLEASEAATREKVEAMAEFLEKLQLGDARERGDSSLKAIEEARDRAWAAPGADERLDGVAVEVQKQLDWIDDLLKKLRKAAAAKAADKVKGVAPRENDLQKKAEDLGEKSEKEAPLPGPVKELLEKAAKKMQEAAEKLEKGEGDKGLELQKEAQRMLEKARDAARSEEPQQPSGGGENGTKSSDDKVDIPDADAHKGPEAFRKRVLDGLKGGATNPKLQEAIKRYAEGLVR